MRCDACPVLCRIRPGKVGACDRYANEDGQLVRVDPLVVTRRAGQTVPFLEGGADWDGELLRGGESFVTGIGAGTTYPDYKPAPFIVGAEVEGVDMVTVVSEGIFSYCGLKVKIDTDRFLGPERSAVRVDGEPIGHVTTAEYGSQMLALGGVRHLTGGSKREGTVTCRALLDLCSRSAVEVTIDDGANVVLQAGAAPVVNGTREERMRVGCGSATIGIFAKQWHGHADEVIVVDDHITGVLTEHQAGRFLDMPPSGIRVRGRKSTPGRYFQVAEPGLGWGGTDVSDPLEIIERIDAKVAWPGLRLLMVSTTGEDAAWYVLDEQLRPVPAAMPPRSRRWSSGSPRTASRRSPRSCSWPAPAGRLRAGVTENPVRLTRSVKEALTRVTCGGAPVYRLAGRRHHADGRRQPHARGVVRLRADAGAGGADRVHPARQDYAALGGHQDSIVALADVLAERRLTTRPWDEHNPWPVRPPSARRGDMSGRAQAALLPDGRRLHLQHGPIDIIAEAFGDPAEARPRLSAGGGALRDRAERAGGRARAAAPAGRRRFAASARGRGRAPHGGGGLAASRAFRHADGRGRRRGRRRGAGGAAGRPARCARPMSTTAATSRCSSPPARACGPAWSPTRTRPRSTGGSCSATPCRSRGVATSGWRGRSFSLGIADAVTVLAASAAVADAAATMIANAVDCDHPAIRRAPACHLRDDTDLGDLLVTVEVGALPEPAIEQALERGAAHAAALRRAGLIWAASLMLAGRVRTVGGAPAGQELEVAGWTI